MKLILIIVLLIITLNIFLTHIRLRNLENKNKIVNYALDIQESRRREDLLLQEVKLLDYQIDVLANSLQK